MMLRTLSAALAISAFVAAMPAFAADGTITFNGVIRGQTCTISGNGQGSNFSVALPPISKSALANAGDFAGRTPFSIVLSNCTAADPGSTGTVATNFEPGPNVNLATGQLIVQAGTPNAASNVELTLLNSDLSKIAVGGSASNSKAVAISNGGATLNYYVQYVAVNGAATPGTVTSTVQYTLVYN